MQVLEDVLARHRGTVFAAMEKLDGTSLTCYLHDGHFGVCSRSPELVETADNLYWRAARQYGIEEKLRQYGGNVAIQGELIGQQIQKNRLGLRGVQLFLFNIFAIDRYAFLDLAAFGAGARVLDLPTVPVVESAFTLTEGIGIPELVNLAVGRSALNGSAWREGLVFRPLTEMTDPDLGRLSFKVINPEYLLKHGE